MALFAKWDGEGRIPEGCTLCELREGWRLECRAGASLEGTDTDRDWRIFSTIRTAPDRPGGGLPGSPSRLFAMMVRR
jgi:hypothetical protein